MANDRIFPDREFSRPPQRSLRLDLQPPATTTVPPPLVVWIPMGGMRVCKIEFHRRLRAAGVDSTLHVLPGVGHGWDYALTRDETIAFFRRTLGPSSHRTL